MTASALRQHWASQLRARGRGSAPGGPPPQAGGRPEARRPLALTGAIAAAAAAAGGLAVLTLLAAVGWIAAPHASVGSGLPGVLRTAVQLWLVGHHVGFGLRAIGPVGLLPLGMAALPGVLLWRSGRWVVRAGKVDRLADVGYAALALALPYGLLAGALAVASRTALSAPSPVQAAATGFFLALAAGGLGGARALAPWGRLVALLPDRLASLVVGVTGSLAVLTGTGALLAGAALLTHAGEFRLISDELSPGAVGAALLLIAGLAYLPNAVIWAICYMVGPGFAFGVGTAVAPTGTVLGPLPMFPMLAALPGAPRGPHPGGPGLASVALLGVPYLAGALGGLLTARRAPSPAIETAPVWGFACGAISGCVMGVLAALSGGPLGSGRLAAIGPSGWQVGLVAILQLGVCAAVAAGIANWLLIRRRRPAASAISAGLGASAPALGASAPDLGARAPAAGSDAGDAETSGEAAHRIYINLWADNEEHDQPPGSAEAGSADTVVPFPVPVNPARDE